MLRLQPIVKSDFKRINEITSNINIMKHIGNGKVWNEEKVKKFIHYNLLEAKQNDTKRTEYYYKIVLITSTSKIDRLNNTKTKLKSKKIQKNKTKKLMNNTELIGIIGFFKQNNEYVYRIFIDEKYQGKGYAKFSLELLKNKVKKHKPNLKYIASYVHIDNVNMNKISHKQFKYVGKSKIGKTPVNKYLIYIK